MRTTDCYHDGALAIGARILGGEYQIAVTNEDSVDVAVATLSREEMEGLGLKLVRYLTTARSLRYPGLAVEIFDGRGAVFVFGTTSIALHDDAESFGIDLIRLTARAA